MRITDKIQLIFVFLLLSFMLYGTEVPKIISYYPTDYQAAPQNWQITQDCDQNIIVANSEGILIYNGLLWKTVTLPTNKRPRSVYLGSDCQIYVSGYNLFGIIEFSDKDKPHFIPVHPEIINNTNQEFWNIFGNSERLILQSFSDVYEYDFRDINRLNPPSNVMLGNSVGNRLFLPKIEEGLYTINGEVVLEFGISSTLPDKSKIVGVCEGLNSNELVVATQNHGIFKLNGNEFKAINSSLNDNLKLEQINKIIKLSDGTFAIGTILNGLYFTKDFNSASFHINKTNGLINNTVLSVFEAKNHDVWIGLDQGINLVKKDLNGRFYYDKNGQLGSVFTSIYHNGKLYIGTNQGVFVREDSGDFKLINNSQGQVWSFLEMGKDLLCGHNIGTFIIKDEQFFQVSDITGGWAMKNLSDSLILQASYTGLILLEKKNNAWDFKQRIENGNHLIENFEIVGSTILSYHPYYGINAIELNDDGTQVIDTYALHLPEVELTDPNILICRLDNRLMVWNDFKFYQFNPDIKALEQVPEKTIIENSTTNPHLSFINGYNQFSSLVSLVNIRFNKPSKEQHNYLIGFDEGYVVLPSSYQSDHLKNSFGFDYGLVNDSIYGFSPIKDNNLAPFENDVMLQLHNKSYLGFNNGLRYKLNNWDTDWYSVPENGRLQFLNLDNGNYQLYLSDNEQVPLLTFRISPHWYESWQGLILYLSLFSLLIYFFNRRQTIQLRKQKRRLEIEKKKELESQMIKAKNEELQNTLVYKNKMLANSTMTLVQKNKMLIDLKNLIRKASSQNHDKTLSRQKLIHLIDLNLNNDQDWELFESTFAEVHEDFLDNLKQKHPKISGGDLKLAAYIRMNLSSKEIAPLLNISTRSIENKRYRLRKKLGIPHDSNLKSYLQSF